MSTRRITIAQPQGDPKSVAFLDDVTLTGLTGSGLITVTGTGTEKTVTTDATKLTLQDGNVKVMTPIVLNPGETAPATVDDTLYSVDNGTTNKLYWNGNALATETWAEANFADLDDFNTLSGRVTTAEGDIDTLEGKVATIESNYVKDITDSENTQVQLHFGKSLTPNTLTSTVTVTTATQDSTTKELSGTGLVTGDQAQDAIDASVAAGISTYNTDVVGAWTTISDKTVKAAIEENKAAIAAEVTRAESVEDAIKADIGNWTSGSKYDEMAVKTAIESLAAVSMFKVVSELPATGETNTIYIVKPEGSTEGPYEEYIWVDGKFEKIGDTDIQLQNYYKKTEIGSGFDTTNTVKAYIEAQDAAVKNTADTATATSTDTHVTIGLTGTVGDHGLTVTTSDIASAADLTALTGRVDTVEDKLAGIDNTVKAYVDAETTRATGVEGTLTDLTTEAKGNLVAAINEVDAHADAETTRATGVESGLDTRLTTAEGDIDAVEGKLAGISGTVKAYVDAETTRATGVEGTLTDLTTEAKGNLVAAINEVDAHADAAQSTADAAKAKADTAVQTATGDSNIDASVSNTELTVGVKPGSTLADLLAYCSIVIE